ncbi:hypothetical protein [Bradyrhizobium sp. NAS96.2]|nr:hypothetical protein [Bradyrhizobium sp. NAS96.2]
MQANGFRALWCVDHISEIARCEALKMIEFYASDFVAFLFV